MRLASTTALRHTLSLILDSHARSQLPRYRHPREALRTRAFSSTPQRSAQEDPGLHKVFSEQQKLLKLFQDDPELLENMKEFVAMLQQHGLNVQLGQMPSKTDMFRLLWKPEVRASAMKMAAAFQEAGIDMQSKEMIHSLMSMQQLFKDK